MSRTIRVLVVTFLCTLVSGSAVLADGGFFPPEDFRGTHLNEPAQRAVIVHAKQRQTTVLFVDYEGGAKHFAWIVPCPAEPKVQLANPRVFSEVVQYYYRLELERHKENLKQLAGGPGGAGGGPGNRPKPPVTVHASRTVGPYQIDVVTATDAGGLEKWLKQNGYRIPKGFEPVLKKYVQEKWYFAAVKVNLTKTKATLKPLRLDFAAKRPVYPLRISAAGRGVSRVLVYTAQPAGSRPADPLYNEPAGSDYAFDFRGLGRACPSLAALRADLDWRKMQLEKTDMHIASQVMRRHDDRTLRPTRFTKSVAMAEALATGNAAEQAWVLKNPWEFPQLGEDVLSKNRKQLWEAAAEFRKPLGERLRRELDRRTANRAAFDGGVIGSMACRMLCVFGDRSPATLKSLVRAGGSTLYANAAIAALDGIDTRESRVALAAMGRGKGVHNTAAWFQYVYCLQRHAIDAKERKEACRNLVEMLSKVNEDHPTVGEAHKLLVRYSGQDFKEDWAKWRKWLQRQ